MEEKDLDHILLDQLHAAKKSKKTVQKLKSMYKNDPELINGEKRIDKRIKFFEDMIQDKSILKKKLPKKKQKENDFLYKNIWVEAYKYTAFVSFYGYNVLSEYVKNYYSYFKRSNNEKNSKN